LSVPAVPDGHISRVTLVRYFEVRRLCFLKYSIKNRLLKPTKQEA
jgi:hypothetical protein